MSDQNPGKQADFGLKKVAFVAMPFQIKPTDLPPGKGPAHVNFDALWEKAIYPALTTLGYMPIRADNQTGSVIIQDMLEQLVSAELVIADISIPNGNVYYEAGVRHAACNTGCILISAEWANPLFDLAQITQLRYPYPTDELSDDDYDAIIAILVGKIPNLVSSTGPVFTLTRVSDRGESDARHLKEVSSVLFDFQTELRTAKLTAADGDKSRLRKLLVSDNLGELPTYALHELIEVVRDYLNWSEMWALLERLPKKVYEDSFFLEQKALVLGKQGLLHKAIALLQTVIDQFGETPERLGTIAGRHRELARDEPNRKQQRTHQKNAIASYRRGMELDLNQYYCAHKLLIALMERGRPDDKADAQICAHLVLAAAKRARALNRADEWLNSTLLVHAFFTRDENEARENLEAILDSGWSNWKLVSLSQDLESVLSWMDEGERAPFKEIFEELHAFLPVAQTDLMQRVLPLINDQGDRYKKFRQIHARPSRKGEVVVSVTADGEETTNAAEEGDMLVKNLTEAKEEYLVNETKFGTLYTAVGPVDDEWTLYDPKGEVRAVEISRDITDMLDVGGQFYIIASWGSEQLAREGDYFVAPLPGLDEIYRIARSEFGQTYRIEADGNQI